MKALAGRALAAAIVAITALPALAGDIALEHPWARATPVGATVGAGYVTIKNMGAEPDRLVSADADVAAKTEIHEMTMDAGVMKMRPADGLAIRPGKSVELKPNGLHLMFKDLKQPLKEGETIKGSLTFEKAGTVPVEYKVEAMSSGHMHH